MSDSLIAPPLLPPTLGLVMPRLDDEAGRLAALGRLDVLDSPPEPSFDRIVGLVRTILQVPIAAVTLVDADRQWFKARQGVGLNETPREHSFCNHTIAQVAPLLVPDALADPRFRDNPYVQGSPQIRAYAGVPLTTAEGYIVGALCAIDTAPRNFGPGEVDLLRQFASLVIDELELRQIARRDVLTGALSRRGLIEAIGREIARCRRHGADASLVLLDVDHFKTVNDTFGHPAGDRVLRDLATVADAALRPFDSVGRLGGEEFGLLLPGTDAPGAVTVADRLRRAIAAQVTTLGDAEVRVTASFGIAALVPGIATADAWLAAADAPLYAAKRAGRNCIKVADATAALAA